jgi:hypothetical protein
MCPRALDLLSRAVLMDIDCNLDEEESAAVAKGFNKVFRALLK